MTGVFKTTMGIRVSVTNKYLEQLSQPTQRKFVFSYRIIITNNSSQIIQINTCNWVVTDALNNSSFIEQDNIIGQNPLIKPGESFSYESTCELKTNFGSLRGYYKAVTNNSNKIQIDIPEFILAHPFAVQ